MHTPVSTRDPDIVSRIDQLIRDMGGDTDALSGRLVREMVQTSLRLLHDGSDTGQQKLISRSFRELRYALKIFRDHRDSRTVSIFGSARTPANHPDYVCAVQFSRKISEAGWMVITGAGDGIMRAGHEGAGRARSFGVSIRLPFETNANEIIEGDPKLITFRYFFTRKLVFVSQADALALFPGGFGTLDEAFEVLTLVQTGKSPMIPIVMVEPPGSEYWQFFDQYVRLHLLDKALISPEDLNLYHLFNDVDAAVRHVCEFYRNYHSQRFVDDRFVIRIKQPLTEHQIDQLNNEFSHLVAAGRIEQTGALEGEVEHRDLPRLVFEYTRRDYGHLRAMIDRINEMAE